MERLIGMRYGKKSKAAEAAEALELEKTRLSDNAAAAEHARLIEKDVLNFAKAKSSGVIEYWTEAELKAIEMALHDLRQAHRYGIEEKVEVKPRPEREPVFAHASEVGSWPADFGDHCPACVLGQSAEKGEGTHLEGTIEHPDVPDALADLNPRPSWWTENVAAQAEVAAAAQKARAQAVRPLTDSKMNVVYSQIRNAVEEYMENQKMIEMLSGVGSGQTGAVGRAKSVADLTDHGNPWREADELRAEVQKLKQELMNAKSVSAARQADIDYMAVELTRLTNMLKAPKALLRES